jgi:hypothetical protein
MRKGEERMKGDERILGRGDFVEFVLKSAQENRACSGSLKKLVPADVHRRHENLTMG